MRENDARFSSGNTTLCWEKGEEKSEITMSLAFWQLWFSQKNPRAFDDTFKPLKALAVEQ